MTAPDFDFSEVAGDSWTGTRTPEFVESALRTLVKTIEDAQEYSRRCLFQFTAGPFGYVPKFQHGQIGAKLAAVIGSLEEVRALVAPAKEGRP